MLTVFLPSVLAVLIVASVYLTSGNSRRMDSTWRALASVTSIDEPTGVKKFTVVSEKSALGTNSVPSKGTMTTLAPNTAPASATVATRCTSDHSRMSWYRSAMRSVARSKKPVTRPMVLS